MKRSKWSFACSALVLAVLPAMAAKSRVQEQAKAQADGAVLTVNDVDAVGTPGDARLSLDEAIRLANGTLSIDRLSAAERTQVKGTPGVRSRDTITPMAGITMTVAKGARVSPLIGNDGDMIEGSGATLVSADKGKGIGLAVSSSNFAVRNLQARGFLTAVDVEFGGRRLANISLEKLHLFGGSFGSALLTVGATKSDGSLHNVSVIDGVFDVGPDGTPAANLVFIRAAATPPGGTVNNVLLDGVHFLRNRVTGGKLGIYLTGSLGGGETVNAVTRNVELNDNIFTGQSDAAINLLGALPAMGGRHSRVGLENVVAAGNRLETPNWGFYMGNENFGWQGKPSVMTDSFFRNIRLERNIITRGAKGVVGHCISIENSADFRGDQTSNNVMENIRIANNDLSGCVEAVRPGRERPGMGAGIIVNAGRSSLDPEGGGGVARDNIARNIEIVNNRVRGSTRGIVVNAGYTRYIGTPPEYSTVTGNRLTNLKIEGNQLDDNPTGIRVTGGDGPAQTVISGNSMTAVSIRGNRVTGSQIACETIVNAGAATGNQLDATCPTER